MVQYQGQEKLLALTLFIIAVNNAAYTAVYQTINTYTHTHSQENGAFAIVRYKKTKPSPKVIYNELSSNVYISFSCLLCVSIACARTCSTISAHPSGSHSAADLAPPPRFPSSSLPSQQSHTPAECGITEATNRVSFLERGVTIVRHSLHRVKEWRSLGRWFKSDPKTKPNVFQSFLLVDCGMA